MILSYKNINKQTTDLFNESLVKQKALQSTNKELKDKIISRKSQNKERSK